MNVGEPTPKRLAIIGGGSSGLITLKYARDLLPDCEVRCYEQSGSITGAWGHPYPGFVSTSTKYTTQFACFPIFEPTVVDDAGKSRSEFFRDGEFGEYLEAFAHHFSLLDHIELHSKVSNLRWHDATQKWLVTIERNGSIAIEESFDAVVLCTGLVAQPRPIDCDVPLLDPQLLKQSNGFDGVRDKTIVIVGGGESAVDFADRLACPELNNKVYLSLRTGIRVSPRYHPIRSVPSDFLRNRLMLSIHEDLRNAIGQRFVELRIRHRAWFERLFPHRSKPSRVAETALQQTRSQWDYRLTKAAKDHLFNMFHNKSDVFLDRVAEGRITIIGPPTDRSFRRFHEFRSPPLQATNELPIDPDLVIPAIGFQSTVAQLTGGTIRPTDFSLGCTNVNHPGLFAVGFTRPIIGNIPSISEMQARYVCKLLAGEVPRPDQIEQRNRIDRQRRERRYSQIDCQHIYPVEMFSYCDQLARLMGEYPTLSRSGGIVRWWQRRLSPASTLHYLPSNKRNEPRFMPASLIALLLLLKPIDWVYRRFVR